MSQALAIDPGPNYAAMPPGDFVTAVSDDAAKWADAFLQIFPDGCNDHATLIGWFANAIEVSSDVRHARREAAVWEPMETAPKTSAIDLVAIEILGLVANGFDDVPYDRKVIWWEPLMNGRKGWWYDGDGPVEPILWTRLPPKPTVA